MELHKFERQLRLMMLEAQSYYKKEKCGKI